jgi:hypothetical protein
MSMQGFLGRRTHRHSLHAHAHQLSYIAGAACTCPCSCFRRAARYIALTSAGVRLNTSSDTSVAGFSGSSTCANMHQHAAGD